MICGMRLADYLRTERITFLKSSEKEAAIRELVEFACTTISELEPARTFSAVWERENLVSTWVAPGIAIPHGRLSAISDFYVALGVSKRGIPYESGGGKPVHLLILILGDEADVDRYIALLAEVARTVKTDQIQRLILAAKTERQIFDIVRTSSTQIREPGTGASGAMSRLLFDHAQSLAREVEARAILFHIDSLEDLLFVREIEPSLPLILVTRRELSDQEKSALRHRVLQVPFSGLNRSNQVSLTLLLALSQGLITRKDRVVGLFGSPHLRTLDSLMIIDVEREMPSFLPSETTGLLGDVKPSVLEKVLQIAEVLAREGREGKPVGALFVIGDHDTVRHMSHQLVINPFKGYRDEEKNILDPSLEETVKEFCVLDGAFLIRSDGVIEAAGAYLHVARAAADLPSGLGARHAAAANITAFTHALSVTISQSTGRVSLFRSGKLIFGLDEPKR
jgi:DNA integrity scanning protein DisA with diadenylate cyclase activity/mannitol/fructose-specific phosphotransferase system IIA component (Ntr-type)